MRRGLSLAEILIALMLAGVALPAIYNLNRGQEREVRWSAHQLDVAGVAFGRLGELEGKLSATHFPRKLVKESQEVSVTSGDHHLKVSEESTVEPITGSDGLFRISVVYVWHEPYVGQEATRHFRTSVMVVDPDTGLRAAPAYKPETSQ
jgi:hypothetical protein